jgi:hypothetical protein
LSEATFSQFTTPLLKKVKVGNPAAAGATIFTPFILTAVFALSLLFFSEVVHVFILLQILKKSNSFFNYLRSIHSKFIAQVNIIIELSGSDNGFSFCLGASFVFLPGGQRDNRFTSPAPGFNWVFNHGVIFIAGKDKLCPAVAGKGITGAIPKGRATLFNIVTMTAIRREFK